LRVNGYRCDCCKAEAERTFSQLTFGWVEISTMVGTAYDRDLRGNMLHICPECAKGLDISVIHANGIGTVVLRGMEGVSAHWCKMYGKPEPPPAFTITSMVEKTTGTYTATAEGEK
jgi:hypothetical protein